MLKGIYDKMTSRIQNFRTYFLYAGPNNNNMFELSSLQKCDAIVL
jgi:hypothetical protein